MKLTTPKRKNSENPDDESDKLLKSLKEGH